MPEESKTETPTKRRLAADLEANLWMADELAYICHMI